VHRVAAAVPSVDLDAHVLRPELLEIARDHTNAEQSQVAISVAISVGSVSVAIKGPQWRDHQRTCSRPGTQPRS
jgi:hypothetical protein